MSSPTMTKHRCIKLLSELVAENSDDASTMHEVLDRNTVQAISYAIAYMYQQGAESSVAEIQQAAPQPTPKTPQQRRR